MHKYTRPIEYWQVKATGEIMEIPALREGEVRSPEWMKAYRHVRLLHHPESCSVFMEDYDLPEWQSSMCNPEVCEMELSDYRCWKMIYDNPDI